MNEEISKLVEEFETRLQEVKDKYEKPKLEHGFKKGDVYWYIECNGKLCYEIWGDCKYDHNAFAIGNAFKTEEEAEFEKERRKVLHELRMMGRPFKKGEENWFFQNNAKGYFEFYYSMFSRSVYGDYYFDTKGEVIEAIEKIGKSRIKKYLFRIEE